MIVTCPKCHEEVLLPGGVRTDAVVRCPLCLEQYSLEEALHKLPPRLEIIHVGEGEMVAAGALAGVGATDRLSGNQFAGSGYAAESPTSASEGGGEWNPIDAPMPAPFEMQSAAASEKPKPKLKTGVRSKRPQANPVKEVVKIVLGGVVGLTLTQGFLWWGFHNDPFDLGPKLGANSIARYIVPNHYWPKDGAAAAENAGAVPPPGPGGATQVADEGLSGGQVDWDAEIKKQSPSAKPRATPQPEAETLSDGFDIPTDGAKQPSEFDLGDPLKMKDAVGAAEKPGLTPSPADEPSREAPEPVTPAAESPTPEEPAIEKQTPSEAASGAALSPAVADASQAYQAWIDAATAEKDVRRKAAETLYASLAKLADAHEAAAGDTAADEPRQALRSLVDQMAQDGSTGRIVEVLGAVAYEQAERPTAGIALWGTVEAVEPHDSVHVTTLVLSAKEPRRVQVVTSAAPEYKAGVKVFVLGKKVKMPALGGDADAPPLDAVLASEVPRALP